MNRKEAIRGRIARLAVEGNGAKRIRRILGIGGIKLSERDIAYHLANLRRQGVIVRENGGHKWGVVGHLYQGSNFHPPPEGVPPNFHPPPPAYDIYTGFQFSAKLLKSALLPLSNPISNGGASYKKWVPLGDSMSADVQAQGRQEGGMVRVKTLLVSLRPFELPRTPDSREKADEVASSAALLAVERFCQDTGVGVFEVKVAKVGECVHPDPAFKGAGRVVICEKGPVEVNQSPPGPAVEYTFSPHGKQDALDALKLPDLLRDLTGLLGKMMAENGKALPLLIKSQTAMMETLAAQTATNQAILETLLSIQNGTAPTRPDSPRRMT